MIVSIAVVAYNAEKTLPGLLSDILNQDYPKEKTEILLIDSMSKDNTYKIMKDFAREHNDYYYAVKLLRNENKTLPYGCNVMLENYVGDVIVRLDAHSSVPSDFVTKGIEVIESGEDISGGQVISICENPTPLNCTLLVAENSVFCGGVAKFRRVTKREYVNTMAFAFYKREVYDKVGPYNVNLARTEDNDMSYRIVEAGYKFCLDPSIKSVRYNRSSVTALLRQKYLNGYWIGKTMGINPNCFSLFHFVPFGFVMGIIVTTLLAIFGIWQVAAVMWVAYVVATICATVYEMLKNEFQVTNLLLPILFFLLHTCYGVGTLRGLIEMPFWVKKVNK